MTKGKMNDTGMNEMACVGYRFLEKGTSPRPLIVGRLCFWLEKVILVINDS